MDARKLLVVSNDHEISQQLSSDLTSLDLHFAVEGKQALNLVRTEAIQVVLLDIEPHKTNGTQGGVERIACLKDILAHDPQAKVITLSSTADRGTAVDAIGLGAFDFFFKPIDRDILPIIVNRAFRVRELEEENRLLQVDSHAALDGVITYNKGLLKVCETVEKVAPSDISVLLLGESGTGKELLARSLHALSARKGHRFVPINCAAIPDTLLESELFGYEKGAFTGAFRQTPGKIELAHTGTLFLDEIGDLSFGLQAKLLRFLQERVIERLGGRNEIPLDVRVVCATHADLAQLIDTGRFREDLYYRISEVSIRIPPLRERDGDIALLARAFLERFNHELQRSLKGYTHAAVAALESYAWPGNVRELQNRVKRAVILCEGKYITEADLELTPTHNAVNYNLRSAREHAERHVVIGALTQSGGKIAAAARLLDISRPTLYDLISKHRIRLPV